MPILTNENNLFLLNTKNTSYCLGIDCEGILRHFYWGRRVERINDFENKPFIWEQGFHPLNDVKREECSSFGSMRFKETSAKICFADGTRDFRYSYEGSSIEGNELTITLKDEYYQLSISLHYRVYEDVDVIEKWRTFKSEEEEIITIERAYSAECSLKGNNWKTINSNGMWNADFDKVEQEISGGKQVFESLRGASGHVANPSFILHQDAREDYGEVYYGALGYSGNFKIVLEQTPYEYLNILAGISDTDFEWRLEAGTTFSTPPLYLGYSANGFATMSDNMARFARKYIMPKNLAEEALPVLYNSWEAMYFDVNTKSQIKLAKVAAEIGAELFVMDDGWFGKRNDDHAGLGDWTVNPEKFPEGLTPLIDAVHDLGMKFGIWIEPEMVNRDSDLYRQHPDWVYSYKTRSVMEGRYQYMLDLTREDVREYIINCIDALMQENEIDYVKWDMNRGMSEVASATMAPEQFKSIWYKHTKGFYQIIQALRERHPKVEWEACASGGGRVDYGAMQFFDEFWPSDNTDPLDRLSIQECYSYLYPIKYMRSWVTESGGNGKRSVSLDFRLHCAMCGAMGIGVNLLESTKDDLQKMKESILKYKEIRAIIQFGKLYRLASLSKDGFQAVMYSKDDTAVLFAFLDNPKRWQTSFNIRLKDLESDCQYKVITDEDTYIRSGAYLMNVGLDIKLVQDYDSSMVQLVKI